MLRTAMSKRKPQSPLLRDRNSIGRLMVAPAVLVILLTQLIPLVVLAGLSVTDFSGFGETSYVGAANYVDMIDSPQFRNAFRNTFVYVIGYVLPNITLALGLAMILNRTARGMSVIRTAYFIPIVVSTTSISLIGLWIFDPRFGLLNYALDFVNVERQAWLLDPRLAMPAIIVITIWQFVGFNVIIFLAGLQSIPKDLYEVAEIDGASGWARFRHVTLPLLAPITFFAFLTTAVFAWQVFAPVLILTNGGPGRGKTTTLVLLVFREAFEFFRFGSAAAMAVVLFGIVMSLTLISFRFSPKENY